MKVNSDRLKHTDLKLFGPMDRERPGRDHCIYT